MKWNLYKPVLAGICLTAMSALNVWAIPNLQLDITTGSTYDVSSETRIATSNPFTLRALIDAGSIDITRNFYLSAAIIPNPGTVPSPDFGSFTINGTTFSSSSGMQYGTPPVDTAINDLQTHSVFPTWYAELKFSAVGSSTAAAYNTQDGSAGPGLLNFVDFAVNVSGLASPYAVHFDLYSYDGIRDAGGKFKIDYFAPFSHDAQSGGTNVPDGGITAILLGMTVMGLGVLQRRFV